MNGNFYKYLYSIHSDIELLEVIIDNFLSFEDERKYDEKKIYSKYTPKKLHRVVQLKF